MKSIFYKILLNRAKNITPNEKILYSFLVSKSISQLDDIFETDGLLIDKEVLKNHIKGNGNRCPLCEISKSKLSKELNQTRPTIINGLKNLIKNGYITEKSIFINDELLEYGYFELVNINKINGELLIFYSFLLDKSKQYDYCIDTYKNGLAKQFGKSSVAITKLLNRLYKKGLAARLPNGKLFIKK